MSNLSQFAAGGDPQYWVSGTTYALGKTVRSPIDHQRYVRVVAGAGTTDPANDATNWLPDGGRAIKSIQRGTLTISGASNVISGTATISSVNTAKTELRLLGWSNTDSTNAVHAGYESPRIVLTNATTITATIQAGRGHTTTISWELTEFY